MEDEDLPTVQADEKTVGSYEAPTVEDLETEFGPTVTAAGTQSIPSAAPRDL